MVKRQMPILALIIAATGLFAALVGWIGSTMDDANRINVSKREFSKCVIQLADRSQTTVQIDSSLLIETLFTIPMSQSRRDNTPARYVIQGYATLARNDGTEIAITLFSPWGYYKENGEYRIADFSRLEKYLESVSKPN